MDADGRARRLGMIIRRCRTLTAAKVVEHLARLEAKHGQATPSRAGIAQAIGRCERSVSRAVGELEAAGALSVVRDRPHCRKDGTWGRHRTNLYRLKWPPKGAKPLVAPKGHAMHIYAPSSAIDPDGGVIRCTPTPSDDARELFEPQKPGPPDPPRPAKPTPPPWVAEGISREEWIRRFAD